MILLLTLNLAVLAGAPEAVAETANYVLSVDDKDRAANTLIEKARLLGGYFASRNDWNVVLKIPRQNAGALTKVIEGLGLVVSRQEQATDVGTEIQRQETLLASRQEVLARYDEVMKQAGFSAVVPVEQQMRRLVQEIESARGQLRALKHRAELAEVSVHFRIVERQLAPTRTQSPFGWLNTLGLPQLLQEFARADD